MTAEKRRVLRMLSKALLLISLPLAGFAWAMPETSANLGMAAAITVMGLVAGFSAEFLASANENDLHDLDASLAVNREHRAHEAASHDERLRQFDRIIGLLTEQNQTLRSKLVAMQVDLQRKREALMQAAGGELTLEDLPFRSAYVASAS